MVVSEQNVDKVRDELRSAIQGNLSGLYVKLASPREFFMAGSSDHVETLDKIGTGFSKATHDLLNTQTIFLRFETMLSISDMEPNQLCRFLEADIDLFFSYVQSIFDYLTEGIDGAFSYKLRDHPSFSKLLDKYNPKDPNKKKFVPTDSIEESLSKLITANESEWIGAIRKIRNTLIHRGAEPRVSVEFHTQEAVFQILQNSKSLILKDFHPRLLSTELSGYLSFKPYAGIVLGRLIMFANNIAELCYQKLGTVMAPTLQAPHLEIELPNVAAAIEWIEAGLNRISEPVTEASIQRSTIAFNPGDRVTRDHLIAYIDQQIVDLTGSPLPEHEVLESIISVSALIKLLTNPKKAPFTPPWREKYSYDSFRAECTMRKFKSEPERCLKALALQLDQIRNKIARSDRQCFGEIDHNWTIDMIDASTAPIPPFVPGVRLIKQPVRIGLQ